MAVGEDEKEQKIHRIRPSLLPSNPIAYLDDLPPPTLRLR
jgi:hypothetical protein